MRGRWMRMMLLVPLAMLAFALFIALGGVVVQYLWNALLPTLFHWPQVTFWQALGLLALCRILFGGFGMHGGGGSRVRRRVVERVSERMGEMSPEARDRLRQRMRERFGDCGDAGEPRGS